MLLPEVLRRRPQNPHSLHPDSNFETGLFPAAYLFASGPLPASAGRASRHLRDALSQEYPKHSFSGYPGQPQVFGAGGALLFRRGSQAPGARAFGGADKNREALFPPVGVPVPAAFRRGRGLRAAVSSDLLYRCGTAGVNDNFCFLHDGSCFLRPVHPMGRGCVLTQTRPPQNEWNKTKARTFTLSGFSRIMGLKSSDRTIRSHPGAAANWAPRGGAAFRKEE